MRSHFCLTAPLTRRFVLPVVLAAILAVGTCGVLAAQGRVHDDRVWVTIGQDAFDMLMRSSGVLTDTFPLKSLASDSGVVVTRLRSRDLNAVSTFMHHKANRCSGFIVHDSFEEATAAMEAARRNVYKVLPSEFTIDQQTSVNTLLPLLDKTNILATIDTLSTGYTNRYYQYTSGQQSALWIRDLWLGYATGRSDVTVTTYAHSFVQPSVIMTIDGTSLASEVVVLGGHLDSIKSGGMTTGTVAPGADDNASGIAALSEVIRVLMNDGWVPDRTVKFMGYAAEEVGLLGSADIAQDHANAGTDVVAVMQLDMTDYNGSVEDISLIDDNTNADLSAFVGDLIDFYQPSLTWSYSTCGYGCSDHASWHNRGYPATMPFEARMGQHNPQIHTSNDTLATVGNQTDHALKFSKLALSFAIETAMVGCSPSPIADAGADRSINDGDSTTIGTPAQAGHTYSWSPGGATTAEVLVSPTSTTTYTVTATTSCGSAQDSVTVTVVPAGQNGPQDAVYDAALGAPKCAIPGSSCDSTTLLDGRANLGPEPNQPNTLDSCTDGTSGSYHSDESNDRIVVSTLDGANFTEGATVRIDATVYAWSTGSSDSLDLYYAADANNPSWTYIMTLSMPGGGVQTLSAQYTLPAGGLQAVRANFRYQGSQSSCSTGSYDDTDDLVFAVETVAACTVDADCDDGAYCNGAEVCNAGTCQAGTAVTCDDGVACTDDACNEGTDSCDFTANDANCDNGLWCDGAETCSATLDCQAGTAPDCDDSVACTADSCNEGTDSCDNTPNDAACDDGAFCNGAETCSATLGCQVGSDPCTPFGCDEVGDVCLECNVDADCDDGLFCNGAETCNAGSCQAGGDPCPGQSCDEAGDVCVPQGTCLHDIDFESGAGGWTNGADTCTTGSFVVGTPDATAWQVGGGNPGNAYYTQPNPGGVGSDDVDGGRCEALSPTIDASGEAAVEVTFDYFHGQRDAGDDAGDGFTVEVLNDGVVVDTVVSIGDVTNSAAWISASSTVVNPGTIQLRVRATDATGGGDIIEGGVDNVQVCPTTPPPPCTLDDDFESGAPDWTNAPASTCTTGAYVTGDPTNPGGGQQIVGSHSGSNSIFTGVNTSAGNADVDGGKCILASPTWAVSEASTLSVWYWHGQRDNNDDPSGDFFQLEYSSDGGASWSPMASNGDSASTASWTQATVPVGAGSDVKIRVQCSDGSSGGDLIECGIDDVSICPQ